jgi:hypothetical protein
VSHRIPLPTAGKLERALEASSRFVAARDPKGLVMRIVAYFACQYCEAVIGLLEGLLAEYRAGTLVLPGMVDDSSAIRADYETGVRRATSPSRRAAPHRVHASGGAPADDSPAEDPRADDPRADDSGPDDSGPEPARRRPQFTLPPPRLPIGRHGFGPRGVVGHPSAVPRRPAEKFGFMAPPPTISQITRPSASEKTLPSSPSWRTPMWRV